MKKNKVALTLVEVVVAAAVLACAVVPTIAAFSSLLRHRAYLVSVATQNRYLLDLWNDLELKELTANIDLNTNINDAKKINYFVPLVKMSIDAEFNRATVEVVLLGKNILKTFVYHKQNRLAL